MSERNPFTLLEAEFALFTVDADDQPLAEAYSGGCVDKSTLDGERKEVRLEYPGMPYGQVFHADEVHSIVLENLWLHEQMDGGLSQMPALARNGRYQLAIVWQDLDALVWAKRIYTGVKAQPNRVDDSRQTLRLVAERLYEYAGTGMAPDVTAALPGTVVYVDGAQRVDLYYYLGDAYSALLAPGWAEIDFSVTGAVTVRIGGDVALVAVAGQLHATEFVALGGTFLDEEPRLEWWLGGVRLASLGQSGVLAMADIIEQGAAPVLDGFEHDNPGWLFSLAGSKAYAPAFVEGGL